MPSYISISIPSQKELGHILKTDSSLDFSLSKHSQEIDEKTLRIISVFLKEKKLIRTNITHFNKSEILSKVLLLDDHTVGGLAKRAKIRPSA